MRPVMALPVWAMFILLPVYVFVVLVVGAVYLVAWLLEGLAKLTAKFC